MRTSRRPLREVADDALSDSGNLSPRALGVLNVLATMGDIAENFHAVAVETFLRTSRDWEGPIALGVRAELKQQLREVAREQRTSAGE